MKKSDINVKLFTEGFDTYRKFTQLEMALHKAEYEINKRISLDSLGGIEDLDDIFTSEEQLRFKKLSAAIHRAAEDVCEKRHEYEKEIIYKNIWFDEEDTETKTDVKEDEFY